MGGERPRSGGEPPDLSLAEPADAVVAIAREPEKVPGGGEEEEHREEVGLSLPGAAIELRHVDEQENQRHQVEVISRDGLSEPAPDSPAVPPPGGELLRPTMGTFDLYLEVGEDERDHEEVRANHEGHHVPPKR